MKVDLGAVGRRMAIFFSALPVALPLATVLESDTTFTLMLTCGSN